MAKDLIYSCEKKKPQHLAREGEIRPSMISTGCGQKQVTPDNMKRNLTELKSKSKP